MNNITVFYGQCDLRLWTPELWLRIWQFDQGIDTDQLIGTSIHPSIDLQAGDYCTYFYITDDLRLPELIYI